MQNAANATINAANSAINECNNAINSAERAITDAANAAAKAAEDAANATAKAAKDVGKSISKGWKKVFSDIRLKENVTFVRSVNDINFYNYNYKGDSVIYTGVIAQELLNTKYSEAVERDLNGYYKVDYSQLPEINYGKNKSL